MAHGSIRKRVGTHGDITYQITIENGSDPVTGKRIRIYKSVNGTKRKAEQIMRNMLNALDKYLVLAPSTEKLQDWMREWLDSYCPDIAQTTRDGYENQIRTRLLPHLGDIPLRELKTLAIQSWVNSLRENGLSPKSIRNVYLNLKAALDKAVVVRKISHNPCTGVVLPKAVKSKTEIYDIREIQLMLDAARNTDMYFPLLLEISVGFRRGELLALKWEDIDLEAGIIHIHRNYVRTSKGMITKPPKSEAGIRDIHIGEHLLEVCRLEYARYQADKTEYPRDFYDTGLVVRQPNGKPFRPDAWTKKWERFLERTGLKHIKFHALRHSYTSVMLQAGVSPKVMQERLGHADIAMTLNVYAHTVPEMNKAAGEKIDELIFQ